MYQNTTERWFPHAFLRKLEREVLRKLRKKTKQLRCEEGTVESLTFELSYVANVISVVGVGRHPCAATITPQEME
jgi:hypothetical protein